MIAVSSKDGRGSTSSSCRARHNRCDIAADAPSSSCSVGPGLGVDSGRHDVLSVRGAAAQIMTHPGNLHFYELCEGRYDDWFQATNERRRAICAEVVEAISAKGGTFRKKTGGKMKHTDALEKTRDRMRQIGRPKVRPPEEGFGPEDVVFTRGTANYSYPGNAKWRALVDKYISSYYRDLVDEKNLIFGNGPKGATAILLKPQFKKSKTDGRFLKGGAGRRRPLYQHEIADEIVSIIHSRGGKFRDKMLNELTHEEALEKTHSRFKDLKKELVAGTKTLSSLPGFVATKEGSGGAADDDDDDALPSAAASDGVDENAKAAIAAAKIGPSLRSGIFENRSGGLTAVKAVVVKVSEPRALERTKRRKRQKNLKGSRGVKGSVSSSDDDDSFASGMLGSDSNGDSSSDNEGGSDSSTCSETEFENPETAPKCTNKRKQDENREERLKRRKLGIPIPQPRKQTKKKRRKSEERSRSSCPPSPAHHPLSEYELHRLKKIQRNQVKLAELGLMTRDTNGGEKNAHGPA
eukprot:CAMPEP_0172532704 /NCGR_PEP_ID=MMETSP1067-20121228/5660_1 /TAXON_ID=265564 ORGANISM="Thalassiosira punctigera, Strain Tpunct2005C2" /NCGR_SAMPLE_ID=MMETSP1067 /ASSEMBLY_ACC=CAM_ASM_000444 /LENGTH=521 /DNA_ID=CAMNT_0013317253 /DNA_START=124 /DNA_END=1685 /DNA_ORIENTATION=-